MAVWGKRRLVLLCAFSIFALTLAVPYPSVQAQVNEPNVFTPTDVFYSPDVNGSIRFATNGSYSTAILENGVWAFTNLQLGFSHNNNVSICPTNCDIKIYSINLYNFSSRRVSITYNVIGEGSQSVKFLDLKNQTSTVEWSVTVRRGQSTVWLSEGQNWDLKSGNSFFIHGIEGNITISRFNLGGPIINRDLPFTLQHSVGLITAGVLIAFVAAAVVVKVARRRSDGLGE